MSYKNIYKPFSSFLLIACIATILQSCIFENQLEPDGDMHLSITIRTGSNTRANHTDDYEEAGTLDENYIDIDGDDIKLVIFDNDGKRLFDINTTGRWNANKIDEVSSYYTFETKLDFPDEYSEDQVNAIRNNGVKVVVLANWKAYESGKNYNNIFKKGDGSNQTLTEVWADKASNNFSYTATASASWQPSKDNKKLIPMFGYAASGAFRNSLASVQVQMQRALAKIEVIDETGQEGVKIEGVTMTKYNTSGRFIPDLTANPDWNLSNAQVSLSSLPDGVALANGLLFVKATDKKWIAYVPEMELERLSPTDPLTDARTHLNVTIGTTSGLGSGTYPVHFAKYDANSVPSVADESWNHILRNHIYRYSITQVGFNLHLTLHVIPWNLDEEEEWDFTDNVSVKPLVWTPGTFDFLDVESNELVMSLEPANILTGVFQIMSPKNGKWYATLVPLDGSNPGAITFCDAEGNILPNPAGDTPDYQLEVSGIIPSNTNTTIYVRPTSYEPSVESRFRLEFHVENMGNWLEAPMVRLGEQSNYVLVRKSNLIE